MKVMRNIKRLFQKRNAVIAAVLVLVCTAIFFNSRYTENVAKTDKILGQSTLVSAQEGESEETAAKADDYFASARLTRQQARDSARSLLEEASRQDGADQETLNEAAKSIQTLASYTLTEAQIENMVTAKGYEDCVVFMAADGISVVVAAREDGLQTEDVAKITDIVKQETDYRADQITIMEVN